MDNSYIKNLVESKYNIKVNALEKIKNVYKVKASDKDYCLKVIKYNINHFLFIIGAIKHLQNNGFEKIPEIIKTINGTDFIKLENNHAYLTPWVNARESNYDNPIDIRTATCKLAELHNKSVGFQVDVNMQPRIGWFKWIENYITRSNEILDFKRRIENKTNMSEFDYLYLDAMDEELEICERAVMDLNESKYFEKMQWEMSKRGFCHHDYAHHNVLIEANGQVDIIDFDYCMLDSHIHDLSSLMVRRMKNGKWDMKNALFILEAYNSIYNLDKDDIPIMAAFMEFPQDYWQIGIQYYWECQPWGEEYFINKLRKLLEDRMEREDFIEEFRMLNFKG